MILSSSSSAAEKKRPFTRSKRRQPRQTSDTAAQSGTDASASDEEKEDDELLVDAATLNDPVNEFIRSYMIAVAKYWPMFQALDQEMSHLFQSVLTRTTIATNMNRTTRQSRQG